MNSVGDSDIKKNILLYIPFVYIVFFLKKTVTDDLK